MHSWIIERFSIECRKTKTKVTTKANRCLWEAMKTQSKTKQTDWEAEKAGDQVTVDFSFAFDWLREWRFF